MSLVLILIIGAIVAGVVANNKRRNALAWVVGSLLFTPLIVIILLVLPTLENKKRCPNCGLWLKKEETVCIRCKKEQPDSELVMDVKKCPYCAEKIKAEAVVCKHCGRDLPKDEIQQASSPYEFK